MEPTGAWQQLIDQGPLVAFMVIVIFFGGKFIKKILDDNAKRELDREARYNALVDTIITTLPEQTAAVTAALTANTAVMERVERMLKDV